MPANRRHQTIKMVFSLKRLEGTWKEIRRQAAKVPARDAIDYLELDLNSREWLSGIRARVIQGSYHPHPPHRWEEAKGRGAFRTLTLPAIEDIVVYRHIADHIYALARHVEPAGAFFSRRHRKEAVGKKIDRQASDDDYESFFLIWLRYNNYRKLLGLSDCYRYVVISDISNYFDSIQHALLLEYLAPLGVDREILGILGKLLDVLRPSAGHSAPPPVGIPVDMFDCSRTLAHIFLFEHDRRISKAARTGAYVRWMDDQNIGMPQLPRTHT